MSQTLEANACESKVDKPVNCDHFRSDNPVYEVWTLGPLEFVGPAFVRLGPDRSDHNVAELMVMRQLLPSSDTPITIDQAYGAPLGSHASRPWVGLSMVASIDGSTVLDGASAGLSSDNDIAVLGQLRSIADVIVVGSGTASGEGYGPPKKIGQRIGVITRSGRIDTSTKLFTSGAGFVITTEHATIDDPTIDVIRAGTDDVDLRTAIEALPTLCPGATFVQAEGGPTLNGAFAAADLLDELNITTSPAMIGGSGLRLVNNGPDIGHRFELKQLVLDDESFVFSRWSRAR